MRRISIILFVLLAIPCLCQAHMMQGIVGGGVPVVGGSTGACTDATHGESNTAYLVCEDYDATSGAANCVGTDGLRNCRNTWFSNEGANATYNYSAGAIQGTYSMQMSATIYCQSEISFTATSPLYVFFKVIVPSADSAFKAMIEMNVGYAAAQSGINYNTVDAGHYKLYLSPGTASPDACTNLAYGTIYNVWFDYTAGTGTNGASNLFVSSDGTKGSACSAVANSTSTGSPTRIIFGHYNGDGLNNFVVDHVRVSTSAMTGVPD